MSCTGCQSEKACDGEYVACGNPAAPVALGSKHQNPRISVGTCLAVCTLHSDPAEQKKRDAIFWERPDGKSRGLGDTIAKATKAVGIEPCKGCKKRRDAANRLFPYG